MKIAVTVVEGSPDAPVDPRFGRASYFMIFDTETESFETLANPAIASAHGAGVQAAQMMCDRKIGAVLTGRVGPNAHQILMAAGIELCSCPSASAKEAVSQYLTGALPAIEQAGPPHGGQGRGRNR